MVVRLAFDYSHGAVELLDGHEFRQLVGKSHFREGEQGVGASINLGREAVRAADDDGEAPGMIGHEVGDGLRQLA